MMDKHGTKLFRIAIVISFISAVMGFLVYLLIRPIEIPIVNYLIYKIPIIKDLREVIGGFKIPKWVIYNFPDAIWAYSFIVIMMGIWGWEKRKENTLWILLTIIVSIGYEVGQLTSIIPGTFDVLDLLFIIIGIGLGLGTVRYIKYLIVKQ